MESIEETPAKRRKIASGDVSQMPSYASQDHSGDELSEHYDTVDTVPLPRKHLAYTTQCTQILSKPLSGQDQDQSLVQVVASSPERGPEASIPPLKRLPGPSFASKIAPAGTAFRRPKGLLDTPSEKASGAGRLSDDDEGPTYQGGSSDENSDLGRRADITPSTFIQNTQKSMALSNADRFKHVTSKALYSPDDHRNEVVTQSDFYAPNQSSDTMANAYGGNRIRRIAHGERQPVPAKAQPIADIDINAIQDPQLKSKIIKIRNILPSCSVQACKSALIKKKSNFDDALDLLTSLDAQPATIDLTFSDDNITSQSQHPSVKKLAAKQQLKAPAQKIHDKWIGSQKAPIKASQNVSPVISPPKPRRRLVQGRRNRSSPVPVKTAVSSPERISLDSEDDDSAIGTEADDTATEGKVLKFLNTCTAADLSDIATTTNEIATLILANKPFKSLHEVRQLSVGPQLKGKKVSATKKTLGGKVVDECLKMWVGYEAIDELVRQCDKFGTLIKAEMAKWGVDVFGSDCKEGELEIATLDAISTEMRDSALGTPSSRSSADEEANSNADINKAPPRRIKGLFAQPSIMGKDVVLKDYQVVGINWLTVLFDKKLSCILADDMGLGKTCQVIAFLAHLSEKGVNGPHLIIVPGSTLENWLKEFSIFCPKLEVIPYYAGLNERPSIRAEIEDRLDTLNVVITTYDIAKIKDDNKFLRRLKPVVCVYDEGHYLRNSKSAGYRQYMRIDAKFRLLLTGTPLQNNLRELASLLGFILPSVFQAHSEDLEAIFSHKAKTTDSDESHAALLSAQRIARAKSMMTPFVLRRKKHQVLKHLPRKIRRVEYCDLTPVQVELYDKEKSQARDLIAARKAGKKTGNESSNIMMALRKASIHPLLFRYRYNNKTIDQMAQACIGEEEFRQSNIMYVYEDMENMTDAELHRFCERYPTTMTPYALRNQEWMDSGKVSKLNHLLVQFKKNGDRVLVFSQFTMVMDILEAVMETLGMQFFRLDGQTKIDERQGMIDQFYQEPEITVFLLSTKAGGAGINLACANKVIIFDSSFNPQDDIQAENRAHRVGQTREVEVVRLVTKNTIEEQIYALGETKLALDNRVTGAIDGDMNNANAESQGQQVMEDLMFGLLDSDTLE